MLQVNTKLAISVRWVIIWSITGVEFIQAWDSRLHSSLVKIASDWQQPEWDTSLDASKRDMSQF